MSSLWMSACHNKVLKAAVQSGRSDRNRRFAVAVEASYRFPIWPAVTSMLVPNVLCQFDQSME
jgi:hypothetical protein